MIDRSHELPLTGQAKALGISRGSVYYPARPTSDADLALMRRIDELHLEHPFAGSRMLRDMLKAEGREVGRRHVATLMKKMGVEAIYRRPNTSKPAPGHKIYPYLLRNLAVTRSNQVWASDITYVPMARGFVYLVAIVDLFSRKVLAWRLSITLSADFCVEALEEALARHGRPEIFNTDQGSQGELNRSSQHLYSWRLLWRNGSARRNGRGSFHALAWASWGDASGGAASILGVDCSGTIERRCGDRSRGFTACGLEMVPRGRRHAPDASISQRQAAHRALPFVRGARDHRADAGSRLWGASHGKKTEPRSIDRLARAPAQRGDPGRSFRVPGDNGSMACRARVAPAQGGETGVERSSAPVRSGPSCGPDLSARRDDDRGSEGRLERASARTAPIQTVGESLEPRADCAD